MYFILIILSSFAAGFIAVFGISTVCLKLVHRNRARKADVGCDPYVPFSELGCTRQSSVDGRNALDEFIVK